MRHRLFHAVVVVGVALPGCGSDDASPVAVDSGVDAPAGDTAVAKDSAVADSGAAFDTATPDTAMSDTAEAETCVGGCGSMCLPCIK